MTKYIFLAVCVAVVSGCSSIPKDAFLLTPSQPEERQMQSRIFATNDEPALLNDSAAILENMGYKTDLVNTDVGLITATKQESKSGFTSTITSILSAGLASTKDQIFKATFTTMPSNARAGNFITRLTLQRMVLNSDGEATSVEPVKDKDLYKIFYERLEASAFIEPDHI
jgi:hypothetical protein